MRVLSIDNSRFENLPDYPFKPNYTAVEPGLNMHYLDEGDPRNPAIVLLHGELSWSFLYRHMIPIIVKAGFRVLAPDLIGFGRSDKLADIRDYSADKHVRWISNWLNGLRLSNATMVCQNWGSLIGLRTIVSHDSQFARVIVANGMLPTGDVPAPTSFLVLRALARISPWFPVGRLVQLGTRRALSEDEIRAYEAPFPTADHKAGARAFPELVPTHDEHPCSRMNRQAWQLLTAWKKPFITCFSDGDPFSRGEERKLQRLIPGAYGQPHVTLAGGHFVQEDSPRDFARIIIDACKMDMAGMAA